MLACSACAVTRIAAETLGIAGALVVAVAGLTSAPPALRSQARLFREDRRRWFSAHRDIRRTMEEAPHAGDSPIRADLLALQRRWRFAWIGLGMVAGALILAVPLAALC